MNRPRDFGSLPDFSTIKLRAQLTFISCVVEYGGEGIEWSI